MRKIICLAEVGIDDKEILHECANLHERPNYQFHSGKLQINPARISWSRIKDGGLLGTFGVTRERVPPEDYHKYYGQVKESMFLIYTDLPEDQKKRGKRITHRYTVQSRTA